MSPVIHTEGLTKRYHDRPALSGLDLDVQAGTLFGYLGPNGAGKTTTIRLLAGLIRPTAGYASVLGADVVRERETAQRRIGYLPGDFVAYPDLTAAEYLRYMANLRGGVDASATRQLAKRLDLDLDHVIGAMSHGNRQKVGIVQALQHDPELLILDEPTQGLDPLVQREFLAMLREARSAGRTVFLCSHVLSEVEAVADTVGILRQGHLVEVASVAGLKAKALRRLDIMFESAPPIDTLRSVPGVTEVVANGSGVQVLVAGSMAALLAAAAPFRIASLVTHEPDLEEIFLTYYGEQG
ncbi:MAG TPA: ABC transporter ATP-binding protein [Actinophytocola sp.]|jgi:ABC-2 type transport system ATP-binding protein|uniref:ABC transporter ATP-binding protein n=1 Tax=Actinophytocola sp. TaxID=1872138 RepID=UPI002F938829